MAIDDNTTYGLTGAQVKELAGQVNSAKTQTGASAPTTATPADYVGQLFYDTTNDDLYCCSAITAQGTDPETYEYTWEAVGGGGGGIPTTATFWGRSYDSGTNKVQGSISLLDSNSSATSANITLKGNSIYSTPSLRLSNNSFLLTNYSGGSNYGSVGYELGYTSLSVDSSSGSNKFVVYPTYFHCNSKQLKYVADPTVAQDAATKNYVDTQVGNIETILQTLNSGTGAA